MSVHFFKDVSCINSTLITFQMSALQKFRKTFSFRKKKKRRDNNETSKPILWQEDERKVREGTCSFQVKVCPFSIFK